MKQPRVTEFTKFINLLMANAPKDYCPWLLRLNPQGKDPIEGISWKNPDARPTIEQATDYMIHGGNIGIAGMSKDPLVDMDCDGLGIHDEEIKPTLLTRSRSRLGRHGFYWNIDTPKIPNISTEDDGEVRSRGQFVVCAGSYVPVTDEELALIPIADRINAGYYTVDNSVSPVTLTFEELPKIFRETWKRKHSGMKPKAQKKTSGFKLPEKHSAVFDVTVFDIYRKITKNNILPRESERWASLFHDSKTSANMSITADGLLHCWRHNYSFNGLQALIVLSKYMNCSQAGTPHDDEDSEGIPSEMIGDNQAIFEAWCYAKKERYIPEDDPIPTKALAFIAYKHFHFKAEIDKPLPRSIYNRALAIVESEY
ncbi:MAG: hypothetical protein ABSD92_12080 [Candidatus Bathyarchaeia archaeon]